MKNLILYLVLLLPSGLLAQIGLKAGVNFANVTNASSINNDSRTGFNVGIFYSPGSGGVIGSHTELLFSRQGYDYKSGTNTGTVDLDYIMLPQFMAINITKYVQIQVGFQIAYLLNAKVDSSNDVSGGASNPYGDIMDIYNRFDYGLGGGLQVHPVSGLIVGARVNFSLNTLYEDPSTYSNGGTPPTSSFIPKVDVKNNLFQLYAGWRFGKKAAKKK
ncbi:MAG: porin family protein [Flavitalea sp.]